MSASLVTLYQRSIRAERELDDAVAARFTEGLPVNVSWGNSSTAAVVVSVHHGSVRVESIHGKVYMVDPQRLLEFDLL